MENELFINLAVDTAFKKYELLTSTNDYSLAKDFLVHIVGVLAYIYGEENILDLYGKKDEKSLNYLLKKYNIDSYYVNKFYEDFNGFYTHNIRNKALNIHEENKYFIYLQEDLINMYLAKYDVLKFDKKKLNQFKELLFTKENPDKFMRDYNKQMTSDEDYILNYYDSKVYEVLNPIEFTLERNNVISYEVYEAFDLFKEDIDKLSFKEIEAINNKIFNYFKISPIEPNVNKKILDAIKKSNPKKFNKKIITKSKMTNVMIFVIIFVILLITAIIIGLKMVGVI